MNGDTITNAAPINCIKHQSHWGITCFSLLVHQKYAILLVTCLCGDLVSDLWSLAPFICCKKLLCTRWNNSFAGPAPKAQVISYWRKGTDAHYLCQARIAHRKDDLLPYWSLVGVVAPVTAEAGCCSHRFCWIKRNHGTFCLCCVTGCQRPLQRPHGKWSIASFVTHLLSAALRVLPTLGHLSAGCARGLMAVLETYELMGNWLRWCFLLNATWIFLWSPRMLGRLSCH